MLKKFLFLTLIFYVVYASDKLKETFTIQQLSESLYVVKSNNSNTNVGVFIGYESILLIDPVVGDKNNFKFLEMIKKLSNKPIKHVLNTHHHNDHSGANSFYINLGAIIIFNKNNQFRTSEGHFLSKNKYSLKLGAETLDLFHIPSHSKNDIIISFNDNNVVFMGDTYMHDTYPHAFSGGRSGLMKVINKTLSISNNGTKLITAHGEFITTKNEFLKFKRNSNLWYKRIEELNSQNMSLDLILKDEKLREISLTFRTFSFEYYKQQVKKTLEKEHKR